MGAEQAGSECLGGGEEDVELGRIVGDVRRGERHRRRAGARRRGVITATGSCPSDGSPRCSVCATTGEHGDDRDAPGSRGAGQGVRAGGANRLVDVREPRREVVGEHPSRARAPCGRTRSGSRQVERGSSSCASTPGDRHRHPEPEERVGAVARRRRARRRAPRAASRASPRSASGCPSPNGPPVHPVLTSQTVAPCSVELLAEHPRVDRGRLRQERLAEAGRERRLRLGDADLGAGELRREAGEEVVERLLAVEPRDRRQDPERVRGQEDDDRRVPGLLRRQRVARSARACTRRACSRSSSRRRGRATPFSSIDDVLEDRPEGVRRREDLGLGLGREADHLRVAAALDVEDARVAPAVLVVADQRARPGRPRASSCRCRRGRRTPRRRRRAPTFAEQCIGKTPSSGSRSFITVKIDFLISPA